MNNDLIERYIYAVSCHLPTKMQTEVEKELENMISELLDARCGEIEPTNKDIRVILTELGSPEELAVKYRGEESKALISGIYLLWFKRVLKIVLPIAAAGVTFATLISAFTEWQPPTGTNQAFIPNLIGEIISGAVNAAMQAFVWVAVIFAILEHKKVKFGDEEFISKLRPVPDKRAQIKIHEPIFNIFWNIITAVLLLGFPYIIGGFTENTGWIPAFDQDYIQDAWYFVIIWTVIGIIHEIYRLIERRCSKKLAIITAVTNILIGVSVTLFFGNAKIMNPNFGIIFDTIFKRNGEGLENFLPPINMILLIFILFSLLLDIIITTYRAFRYDKI